MPRTNPASAVDRRHEQELPTATRRVFGHRERSRHRSDRTIQGQLSHGADPVEGFALQLVARAEQRQGNGQIVLWPRLAQIRGRQVDDDATPWDLETLVGHARSHALT